MKNIEVRLLLVEDNPGDARLIREYLSDLPANNVAIVEAASVTAAEAFIAAGGIDMVLLDLSLPDSRGVETLVRIQKADTSLPVIVLTGSDDRDLIRSSLSAGAQDYLIKGQIDGNVLLRAIHYAIERRKSVAAVLKSELEWRMTFDAMSDAVCLMDQDHIIRRCNSSFMSLLDKPAEAIIGRRCWEVVHSSSEAICNCPFVRTKGSLQRSSLDWEMGGKCYRVVVDPILDDNGVLTGSVHVMTDMTAVREAESARAKLEARLNQVQRLEAIGTLAGGIAHDFNNILSGLAGYAELVYEDLPEDTEIKSHQKQVFVAVERAKSLVKQILTFSRHGGLELKPTDIHPVVAESLKLLRASIPSSIAIRQNLATGCGAVLADPTNVHQIVMNLCTNAYHAMKPAGGVLTVSLTRQIPSADEAFRLGLKQRAHVVLDVTDTGVGIEKSHLSRIFEPYFTTKKQGEGTGLGLAVVHGIVKSMDGHIDVKSEPGKGSSFRVYFPDVSNADVVLPAEHPRPKVPRGAERILVVDDEEQIVSSCGLLLKRLGYRVVTSTSSEQALRMVLEDSGNYDLIITDMTMPGLNGAEFAERVMAVRPGTPVILCTGYSENMDAGKAGRLGICEYIEKPFSGTDLAHVVRKALDKTKADRGSAV